MDAFLRNNGRMEKWIMSYFVIRALREYWHVLWKKLCEEILRGI